MVSVEVAGTYLPRSMGVEAPHSIHIEVQGQNIRAEDQCNQHTANMTGTTSFTDTQHRTTEHEL